MKAIFSNKPKLFKYHHGFICLFILTAGAPFNFMICPFTLFPFYCFSFCYLCYSFYVLPFFRRKKFHLFFLFKQQLFVVCPHMWAVIPFLWLTEVSSQPMNSCVEQQGTSVAGCIVYCSLAWISVKCKLLRASLPVILCFFRNLVINVASMYDSCLLLPWSSGVSSPICFKESAHV